MIGPSLLLLCALAAEPFSWSVPEQTSWVDVSGVQVAQGIPMKLAQATSQLPPEELLQHFMREFEAHALYVPPPDAQVRIEGGLQLTALDVDRLLSYTVMLKPLGDGKGTKLLLSTANVGATKPPATTFVPVMPKGSSLLQTDAEGGKTLAYAVSATEEEVAAFYKAALTRDGWTQQDAATFTKAGETVHLTTRPLEKGRLSVLLRSERLKAR